MGQVLMFTSLKGGVGKTTACASLAFALNFFSRRVLCVDLDFGVRGLDLSLGAENTCGEDVLEVIRAGSDPLSSAVCVKDDLYFLSAPALFNTREEAGLLNEELDRFLRRCREEFDYTLLDLPAGGGELFLPLANSAEVTEAVVVSTAETAALRAAEQTGFEIRAAGKSEVRLLLNRVSLKGKGDSRSLFEMAKEAAIPVLGVVPEDDFALKTQGQGIPLSRIPHSPAGRAYWNVAARLLGSAVPLFSGVVSKRKKRKLCRV